MEMIPLIYTVIFEKYDILKALSSSTPNAPLRNSSVVKQQNQWPATMMQPPDIVGSSANSGEALVRIEEEIDETVMDTRVLRGLLRELLL
ncbi:hypothetical protein TorRG33x02_307910 [Trema orientale]|uniref:Uncharacterized protein n=1 Tax=Trema orientale TaxID=63057 RepID=A0A2P5BV11_TREOI|nr:hypothetical protein TorRG33x02_307910 [Trema orientale]